MDFETILFEKNGGVAKITFNRPDKLNALNGKMLRETTSAIEDADSDKKVRVIVITGAGRAFSAGNDISDFTGSISGGSINKLFEIMIGSGKPVISAVNGLAYGGGCEIVLASDISIAKECVTFCLPEPKLGIIPPFATWLLPPIVGINRAKYLMLTCDKIDAKEAERIGLINKVVSDDKLDDAVKETASKVMDIAPLAIREIKFGIDRYIDGEKLKKILPSMGKLFASKDFRVGVQAFVQKRKPKFGGM